MQSGRPDSPSLWWGREATSCSAATPRSATCPGCTAGRGGCAGFLAGRWRPGRGWSRPPCSFPTARSRRRPAGPSCLAWCAARTPLAAISVLEQRLFLAERLLRDNDAASMAASIEQRLPLVDKVLFEAVLRLPDAARYQPVLQKAALRRIGLRGLDPALFDRPKSGFVLPFDRWIRRGLSKAIGQTLLDPVAVSGAGLSPTAVRQLWQAFLDGAPGLYWSRIWAIYVLVRWCLRHGVHR